MSRMLQWKGTNVPKETKYIHTLHPDDIQIICYTKQAPDEEFEKQGILFFSPDQVTELSLKVFTNQMKNLRLIISDQKIVLKNVKIVENIFNELVKYRII